MTYLPFLICHRGALGDFILTWPALHCLREILPEYHFLGLGRFEYMRLAISLNLLDSCLSMESARMLDFFSGKSLPPEIGAPHGAVLWLSNGQAVAKLLKASTLLPVVSIAPFPTTQIHVAHYYCLAIQPYFPITIPQNLSDSFPFREARGKYVLIHPGSGSFTKNYMPQFYRGLADELRWFGYSRVGFILGPVEQERGLTKEFAGEWIEQPENVEHLADLLAGAALYIGNDSGVSHLSGILGTPTVVFYKTTDPKVWGVVGRKVVHLSAIDEKTALDKIRAWLKTKQKHEKKELIHEEN